MFTRQTNYRGGSAMIWNGISSNRCIKLHVCHKGTATARFYMWDILLEHAVPYSPFFGRGFILQQDSARPHTAHETQIPKECGNCSNGLASMQPGLGYNRTCFGPVEKTETSSQSSVKFAGWSKEAPCRRYGTQSLKETSALLSIIPMPRRLATVIQVGRSVTFCYVTSKLAQIEVGILLWNDWAFKWL